MDINPIRRESLIVSETVRSNLTFLYSILDVNDNSLTSISSSENDANVSHPDQNQDASKYFPEISMLLKNSHHPFKCVGLYSRLLQAKFNDNLYADPIFSGTFYNAKIHPLLTAYLEKETPYYRMSKISLIQNSRRRRF